MEPAQDCRRKDGLSQSIALRTASGRVEPDTKLVKRERQSKRLAWRVNPVYYGVELRFQGTVSGRGRLVPTILLRSKNYCMRRFQPVDEFREEASNEVFGLERLIHLVTGVRC